MAQNFESVKLRCLVDSERAKRDDCPPLDHEISTRKERIAMPLNRQETERIKRLVMERYAPKGGFTMQDVYDDRSDPLDLNMYEALDELVDERKLRGPKTKDDGFSSHSDMRYRKATQKLREDVIRLAYAKPELRPHLLPLIDSE